MSAIRYQFRRLRRFPQFACGVCGALVDERDLLHHHEWHERSGHALPEVFGPGKTPREGIGRITIRPEEHITVMEGLAVVEGRDG